MEELGIYIHIPFCRQKCNYCDFISYSNKEKLKREYIESITKEIKEIKRKIRKEKKYKVTTIYIGGGTPSSIESKYIIELLKEVRKELEECQNVEIDIKETTIEVNPGTIDREKIEDYKNVEINRISIGLQSTEDKLLKQIGRIHNYEQFIDTYKLIKEVGIQNTNIDLMIGLPNQTIEILKESIEKVIELEPNHISVYSLIVEEGTKISKQIDNGEMKLPKEETEREMYWYTKNALEKNGYEQYEISNFAKKGYRSKHNVNCWEQKEYIGIGLAAHSYINGTRKSNIENIEEYIKNIQNNELEKNVIIHEKQGKEDKMLEYMLLGLRMIQGISIQKFKNKFNCNPIFIYKNKLDFLVRQELIIVDEDNIRLTDKGLDLANIVWEEFV